VTLGSQATRDSLEQLVALDLLEQPVWLAQLELLVHQEVLVLLDSLDHRVSPVQLGQLVLPVPLEHLDQLKAGERARTLSGKMF
jgi:hypothetical protein